VTAGIQLPRIWTSYLSSLHILSLIMLFSGQIQHAATSKNLVTTSLGRGTYGYRAPEVITRGRYNKRSHIFAVGCISYEIVMGQKPFRCDWAVQEYVREGVPLYTTKWPPCKAGTRLLQLGELTSILQGSAPRQRPTSCGAFDVATKGVKSPILPRTLMVWNRATSTIKPAGCIKSIQTSVWVDGTGN
jgi:serine/threonine protein kinase